MSGPIQQTSAAQTKVEVVGEFVRTFTDQGIIGAVVLGLFILAALYIWRRRPKR